MLWSVLSEWSPQWRVPGDLGVRCWLCVALQVLLPFQNGTTEEVTSEEEEEEEMGEVGILYKNNIL